MRLHSAYILHIGYWDTTLNQSRVLKHYVHQDGCIRFNWPTVEISKSKFNNANFDLQHFLKQAAACAETDQLKSSINNRFDSFIFKRKKNELKKKQLKRAAFPDLLIL